MEGKVIQIVKTPKGGYEVIPDGDIRVSEIRGFSHAFDTYDYYVNVLPSDDIAPVVSYHNGANP